MIQRKRLKSKVFYEIVLIYLTVFGDEITKWVRRT